MCPIMLVCCPAFTIDIVAKHMSRPGHFFKNILIWASTTGPANEFGNSVDSGRWHYQRCCRIPFSAWPFWKKTGVLGNVFGNSLDSVLFIASALAEYISRRCPFSQNPWGHPAGVGIPRIVAKTTESTSIHSMLLAGFCSAKSVYPRNSWQPFHTDDSPQDKGGSSTRPLNSSGRTCAAGNGDNALST